MDEQKARQGEIAELMVKKKLEDLPPGYSVIANVDIAAEGKSSELDTVVVTPTGVIVVLEIKAGNLIADESGHVVRDYGAGGQKDIVKQLNRQGGIARNRLAALAKNLTIRSFLVLPTGKLDGYGIGIDSTRVIDADRMDELCNIILDCDRLPHGHDISKDTIVEFLENHCVVKQSLSSISETLDIRCRELSSGLATWIPRIESPLAVVEVNAPAGSGKTQLALSLLQKAHQEKRSAWYINTTRNIAQKLQDHPINQHVEFIGTWHELAIEKTRAEDPAGVDAQSLGQYFNEVSEAFVRKLEEGSYSIDCIVLDDAQDLKSDWVAALTYALSSDGTLYVLSDPNFNNNETVEFTESVRVTSSETARIPQRVTQVINELALSLSPLISTSPYQGEIPAFFTYDSSAQLLKETRRAVDEARKEGFADDQIAILTMKGRHSSKILCSPTFGSEKYSLKQPLDEFKNGRQLFSDGTLFNDTVRRFKGLQAPCIILTEVDFEELDDQAKSLLYLGMTRASMSLKLVLSECLAKQVLLSIR